MNLQELPFDAFPAQFQSGDIDMGFLSEKKIKGFEFHPLFKDPLCLIMHRDHPFARYSKISAENLNGCDFIMPVAGWDDTVRMVQNQYPFSANVRYEVASDTAAISLTAENQGVYIMSNLQASLLPENVVSRPFKEEYFRVMGYTVKTIKNATPALSEFIKTTEHVVAEYVAHEGNLLQPV